MPDCASAIQCMYMLMRDTEGRKEEASKAIQTIQVHIEPFSAVQYSNINLPPNSLCTLSPSSLCCSPLLSRKSRDPLASQILTFLSLSCLALVVPATNHRSSSATPRQNTRLVVRRGNWSRRLNLFAREVVEGEKEGRTES